MKFLLADLDLDPHEHATEELRGDREVVMTAICQNGASVFQATNQITCDEEVIQAALASHPYLLIGLRVFLLSVRSCTQVFYHYEDMYAVLRRCAELLDMSPDVVMS